MGVRAQGVQRDREREEGKGRSRWEGGSPGQHVLTHPHAFHFPCFLGILMYFRESCLFRD